eukprot:Clim_evm2s10 gene=Clim_evmTU2s10
MATKIREQPSHSKEALAERRNAAYKDLPWTAFFVSWIKAEEDPILKIFFKGNDMQEEVDNFCGGHRWLWNAHRVHFFDRVLRESVRGEIGYPENKRQPATQVVNLGAGLDTRSIRMAEIETPDGTKSEPRYFEVDREAITDYKKMCYDLEGYNYDNNVIIGGDYIASFDDVFHRFQERGLKRDEPTTIVWEGNTAYFPRPVTLQTIANVCKFFKDTTVYFAMDIVPTSVTNGNYRDVIKKELGLLSVLDQWDDMGLPRPVGYDDVETDIVKPVNVMLAAEGINGKVCLVSNEPLKDYANLDIDPDISDDANLYRMVNLIYQV